ncbi:STAS/SEC14 domain-containing protein [Shimia sp. MMG029]|uniref:STAS/SEC14 domain-containing protein n=1 Tax=Shimia sp. MMG029 TaxID=3021978 RepID=UPI0022FDBD5E|nr:STAS/SEC14 domain-containing protein [Shimia sp. MMG029]MDA5557975.1 STAS/SEC14 domain-containing protein [Shimia sp. MMG029]
MIDVKTSEDARFVEITMTAPISEDDYTTTLAPAIDKAIETADHIRLLAIVDGGMSDFTFGALREDSRMGLKHWRGFDRVALVTDDPGIRRMVGMFSVFMPCPVAQFSLAETDTARLWLRESLGSIQIDALAKDTVVVRLMGKLDSETYAGKSEDLDTIFATMGEVGLVIDLREFDGWQGLGALKEHFALAHSHVGQLRRAAIVGDAGWQAMASKFGKHVVGLDAKHFGASAYEEAIAWVQAPD